MNGWQGNANERFLFAIPLFEGMALDYFVVISVPDVFGEWRTHVRHVLLSTDHEHLDDNVETRCSEEERSEL